MKKTEKIRKRINKTTMKDVKHLYHYLKKNNKKIDHYFENIENNKQLWYSCITAITRGDIVVSFGMLTTKIFKFSV